MSLPPFCLFLFFKFRIGVMSWRLVVLGSSDTNFPSNASVLEQGWEPLPAEGHLDGYATGGPSKITTFAAACCKRSNIP